jgi:hypothetical protein
MSEQEANITVNLLENSFSISGSEAFVEKNGEKLIDFLEKYMNIKELVSTPTPNSHPNTQLDSVQKLSQNEKQIKDNVDIYIKAGVYHIDAEDGTISILKKVPGNNKAERARNIALIVLYIKKERISNKLLIPICEKHTCYDKSNFSAWFKNEKTNMIRKGNGQSWTLELTQPGEEAAIELLEGLANAAK